MRKLTLFVMIWATALSHWGCRKDVLEVHPYPVSIAELNLFLNQVPDASATTVFDLDHLNEDRILSTPGGVRVYLTDVDHLFGVSGAPVAASTCGDLKIEVTTAFSKGDMLGRGLTTYAVGDTILRSAGMVQVTAFCGATELQLMPGRTLKIQLPSSNPSDDLWVYEGIFDGAAFKGWQNSGQIVYKADWPVPGGNTVEGYELNISRLGWSGCARPLAGNVATSPFCSTLQSSFTGLNTQVFLVFENFQSVVPLTFDNDTYSFCFPNVPAGYPVRVVTIAKQDTGYWMGSTTTETGTNTTLNLDVHQTPAQQILGYLRSL